MNKKVYIESYGCQMNVSDSEVVASILAKDGYVPVQRAEEADLVLLNTCSIREKAEYTVLQRINEMNNLKALILSPLRIDQCGPSPIQVSLPSRAKRSFRCQG